MRESSFQKSLKKELKERFPGCIVLKNDANMIQGIPDLLILYEDKWAALECKKSARASKRPNQDRRIEQMNDMSFARFIYPENKEDVLNELQHTFQTDRTARLSGSK